MSRECPAGNVQQGMSSRECPAGNVQQGMSSRECPKKSSLGINIQMNLKNII